MRKNLYYRGFYRAYWKQYKYDGSKIYGAMIACLLYSMLFISYPSLIISVLNIYYDLNIFNYFNISVYHIIGYIITVIILNNLYFFWGNRYLKIEQLYVEDGDKKNKKEFLFTHLIIFLPLYVTILLYIINF